MNENVDVLIVGAGPAGCAAAARLHERGRSVLCVDRDFFPRFVIGESLLPRCNELLAEIGMLDAVAAQGYLVKPGAVFLKGSERERFSFAESLDGDRGNTWQVPRDHFDQVLATETLARGVDLRFGHRVEDVHFDAEGARARVTDIDGDRSYDVAARFVLDASGYGRVLPRLLDLERPALLPHRISAFTHLEGDRRPSGAEEGDIWICVHPRGGWFWIIPFSNGRTSVGIVCDPDLWESVEGTPRERLFALIAEEPNARERLRDAAVVAPMRVMEGYSKKVSALHGERWALVGNASDFLDPVFSSGVTLALETALLAANLTDRTLSGEAVDWTTEYDAVVGKAVGVFLAMIEGWYREDLQAIFFTPRKPEGLRRQITSLLGGHVLRPDNPFVEDPKGQLDRLVAQLRP